MLRSTVLLSLIACLLVAEVLRPVDEAARDPSFLAFRDRLTQAVAEEDFAFVENLITPQTKLSFGGHEGPDGFRELWSDRREKLWTALQEVLRLGGRLERREGHVEFTAPYVYTDFPESLDAFTYEATIVSALRVRRQPSLDAGIVDMLRYETAEMIGNDHGSEWRKVRSPRGVEGYVAARYMRSAVDYRLIFSNASGDWKIIFFVAGD
jgi:hypothetical protein